MTLRETMNEITEPEIKQKLADHYGGSQEVNDRRELVKNERMDNHGEIGSVVYSLSGSPPKGYAIAIPGLKEVSLYDNRGKRFRRLTDTTITGVDDD